jgi:lambda family phage portal protein
LSIVDRLRFRAANWVAGRQIRAVYGGGSVNRLLWDWAASILSPDSEIRGSATLMRARARQLARDNAIIAGFLTALEDNVIGPDGFTLQAEVKNGRGELAERTNWEIEDAWKEWGYPENASLDTRGSWHDLQVQMIRNLATDGEVFLRRVPGAENDFQYAIQLIDPDQVDESYNVPPDENGIEIRMGIELNRDGRPLAYHVLTSHPSEISWRRGKDKRTRIDAGQIKHLFVQLRPGQTRGVSWFAPILTTVKHMDGYEEAELIAARIQASQAGVIETVSEEAIALYASRDTRNPKQEESEGATLEMAPGVIPELDPGKTLKTWAPTHPNMNFGEFCKALLRPMARALGISYLTLTGDVSAANYSSMRSALIPERDHFRRLQTWFSTHACRWVYRGWVPQALLAGALKGDSRLSADYFAVAWQPHGWRWVDPLNDLKALALEMLLGINSPQRACGERGADFEEIIDELAAALRYAKSQGIDISPARALAPGQQPVESEKSSGKNENEPEARTPLALLAGGAQ